MVPTVLISVASIFPVDPVIVIPVPTDITSVSPSNVIDPVPTVRMPVTLASPFTTKSSLKNPVSTPT